jgi:hypothetical protein
VTEPLAGRTDQLEGEQDSIEFEIGKEAFAPSRRRSRPRVRRRSTERTSEVADRSLLRFPADLLQSAEFQGNCGRYCSPWSSGEAGARRGASSNERRFRLVISVVAGPEMNFRANRSKSLFKRGHHPTAAVKCFEISANDPTPSHAKL